MNLHADPIHLPTLSLQRSLAHRCIVSWKLASLSLSLSHSLSPISFQLSPFRHFHHFLSAGSWCRWRTCRPRRPPPSRPRGRSGCEGHDRHMYTNTCGVRLRCLSMSAESRNLASVPRGHPLCDRAGWLLRLHHSLHSVARNSISLLPFASSLLFLLRSPSRIVSRHFEHSAAFRTLGRSIALMLGLHT